MTETPDYPDIESFFDDCPDDAMVAVDYWPAYGETSKQETGRATRLGNKIRLHCGTELDIYGPNATGRTAGEIVPHHTTARIGMFVSATRVG